MQEPSVSNSGDAHAPVERLPGGAPFGCLLPVLTAIVGLIVGKLIYGLWLGVPLLLVAWLFGMRIYLRRSQSGGAIEFGCVGLLVVLMIALLIPAVQKIKQNVEQRRMERKMNSQELQRSPKEIIRDAIATMPDHWQLAKIVEELRIVAELHESMKDFEAGRYITHAEMMTKMGRHLRSSADEPTII